MSEQSRARYAVSAQSVQGLANDLNYILNRISDRLDQIEGIRGTPTFYKTEFNIKPNDTSLTTGQVLRASSTTTAEWGTLDVTEVDGATPDLDSGTSAQIDIERSLVSLIDAENDYVIHQFPTQWLEYNTDVFMFTTNETFEELDTMGGDVAGPVSAVNNDIATFDGTTGKLLKDSGVTLTGGTNTFNITSGTGSLDVAAAKTVNIDDDVTVSAELHVEAATHVNQDLTSDASPTFVTAKLSGLTDGKMPYHVDDATGFADGPTKTDVDDAVTKAHSNALDHAAVTVSAPISLSGQAISLVNNAVSPATVTAIDTDGTLAGNSDTAVPTQKAVKTYADTKTTLTAVKADADVADAISKKHTAGTDTALGAVSTKNPPIDADKALYRDSTASDALVTSTWTQIKAFLKTYFDTQYNNYVHPNHSGDVTSVADGAQTIANDAVTYAKMQNVSATDKVLGRSTAGAGDVEEIACTAFARSILDDANEATFKATVNLEIGTDVQAYDATLTSIALLGTAADKIAYTTNVDTWAETAITAAGRALLDDANAAAQATTLGLGTGDSPTHVTVKLTGLTDGYYSKHTSDATGLENGVLYQDAASRVIAGGTTIPANDMLGLNLMSHAKGQLIDSVYSIVTPANVRLFLVFDQSGAVSTITDRSTIGGTTAHVTTLRDGSLSAINASTCTPGVSGLAPYLTHDANHVWNVTDADDLSFAGAAFSIVLLHKIGSVSTVQNLFAKHDLTTGSTKREIDCFLSGSKVYFRLWDQSAGAYIGRYYNTVLTTDQGNWHVYGFTKGTGETSAAINIYRDGVAVDDQDSNSGSYVAMEDTAANFGSYQLNAAGAVTYPNLGATSVMLVVAEELTAVQAKRLDAVLRAYAGVTY